MKLFNILTFPITAPIKFIQNHFKATLFVTILIFIFTSNSDQQLQPANLAKINLYGPISDVNFILEEISTIKRDDSIKGVLIDINSPGGAVAPSIEIAYAIKELTDKKPVVVYASGVMASGSYYASIWSSKIIANPGSIIGSIGVILQSFDGSEFLKTIGIKPQNVIAGKFKEVGTPTRNWETYEKEELEKVIQGTYTMFVNDVANARNLDIANEKEFANAHIFTAQQAFEVGLIDEVNTISKAKKEIIRLANIKEPQWRQKTKIDAFMDKLLNEVNTKIVSILFNKQLVAY